MAAATDATTREWRWMTEPEPESIPENWTAQGVEPAEAGEEHWYAVAYKAGTQLQWTIDQRTGEPVDGPHREDRRIAVVYVRGDCERAVVIDYRAERGETGWRPDASEFRSVRAHPPDAGGPVGRDNRADYLTALEEYYDVDHRVDRAIRTSRGESA